MAEIPDIDKRIIHMLKQNNRKVLTETIFLFVMTCVWYGGDVNKFSMGVITGATTLSVINSLFTTIKNKRMIAYIERYKNKQ